MEMVSQREYQTRVILKNIDNTQPSLTDYYIMQLTQYLCVVAGSKTAKLNDFILKPDGDSRFSKEEIEQHQKNIQAFTEAQWRSRLGDNAGFKYTPAPNEEE